jgi:hypothetical protein
MIPVAHTEPAEVRAITDAMDLSRRRGGIMVEGNGMPGVFVSGWGEVKNISDVKDGAARAGRVVVSAYTFEWSR